MTSKRAATFTATYTVGNICGNPRMPRAKAASDIGRLFDIGADVTGAVEIDHADYKREFSRISTRNGKTAYNLTVESPIATALPVKRSWVTKLYSGVARVTPGRFNSGLRLDVPVPMLVIVKHPVSGANRQGAAARRTFGLAIRKRLFALDTRRTSAKIKRANAAGVSVVVMGDLNYIRPVSYTGDQIVAAHAGLMDIIVCPAPGVTVTLGKQTKIPQSELHTDHAFIAREITLTGSAPSVEARDDH